MGPKRLTLEELSEKIQVSRTTIYKVINSKGTVSEKTRKIILKAIEEYCYRPNRAAKTLAMGKTVNIGFIGFHSPRSPHFLKNILSGVDGAEKELHDYGLHVEKRIYGIREHEKQIEALEELSAAGYDAIAIIPNDVAPPGSLNRLTRCIDKLMERGTPVVTVNRDIPGSKRSWYVGCDYRKSGILAAEILGKMTPPGEILVPVGGDENELIDLKLRLEGFRTKIADFPHLEVLPPFHHYGDDPSGLKEYLETQLCSNPAVTGLFDLSYDLEAVSGQVKKHGNRVKVIGFDLCESVKSHMKNHIIDVVLFQDMFAQGYSAVKSLYESLTEEGATSGDIMTKLEVVYEGNLDFYIL